MVAIAAGYYHNLALKSDGTVVAWGDNRYGKCTVPAGLNGVVAIAGGSDHSLALKSGGTVAAWGYDGEGEINVPTGLSGVVAIIASGEHNLALKTDSTVVAWGYDVSGASEVPAGLNGVVAIAAGIAHSLALKNDGTVVSWGRFGQGTVPTGLSGVVAIAAGGEHSLALRSDGAVVAWGDNSQGESTVPAGLSGVVAIAAGYYHSLALRSDGTVVAWGDNSSGQSTVPAGLRGVLAIAAGEAHSLALAGPSGGVPVTITVPPQSQIVKAGATVSFSVTATGTGQLSYQWRFNGANITGATSSTMALNSVGAGNNGAYSVVVWNAINSVVSAPASLAVLAVDTTTQPTLPTYPAQPTGTPGKDSLVFITHGRTTGPDSDDDWVDRMKASIQDVVPANWMVLSYKWIQQSRSGVDIIKPIAEAVGRYVGADIMTMAQLTPHQKWEHVHLIGHSAGAALINEAAWVISDASPTTTIHTTFLDAYTGVEDGGRVEYGEYSQWADSYFAVDNETADPLVGRTDGPLVHAYNVDVTWLDPNALSGIDVVYSADSTPAFQVFSSHGWPIQFYQDTITGGPPGAAGYGFPFSKEGGGWDNNLVTHSENNAPVTLPVGGHQYFGQSPIPVRNDSGLQLDFLPNAASSSGVIFLGNGGASLTSDDPAWLAVGLTVTNAVNFVQFGAGFTDTNGAVGLLTVYWNTNQIGMVDERAASPGLQTYRFALPGTVTDGLYSLGFRLDAFTNASTITVTNVATGFAGITQPITLDILRRGTNNAPVLKLTAAPGYNYLVQS